MGPIQSWPTRLKSTFAPSPPKLSYFDEQQQRTYTKQMGIKCLEFLSDMGDFGQGNSLNLRKIGKYLNPAVRCLQGWRKEKERNNNGYGHEEQENYIRMHEEELINSATSVLAMYCQFLRKVVPANISYFHFMRQKDLYTHFCTLRYILQAGHLPSPSSAQKFHLKSASMFSRLKSETRLTQIRLISHWLYDMIKYKCSAVYLESRTLPHLIAGNAAILCGLMGGDCGGVNFLEYGGRYGEKEKDGTGRLQVYQHCMYAFTYLLTEANKNRNGEGYGAVQIALYGIVNLLNFMWREMGSAERQKVMGKIMFAPSYWFAEEIGFLGDPRLENLVFRVVLDMIKKINVKHVQQQQQTKDKNKDTKNKTTKSKQSQAYQQFIDESQQKQIKEQDEIKMRASSVQLQNIKQMQIYHKNTNEPLNLITYLMLYNCLKTMIDLFGQSLDLQILQLVLAQQIKQVPQNSIVRPFMVQISKSILHLSSSSKTSKPINLLLSIKQFANKDKIHYSTQYHLIPYHIVALNCERLLSMLGSKIVVSGGRGVGIGEKELWAMVLTINTDKFQQITA